MSRRRLLALAGIGALIVALARVVAPQAPPLYDGITIAPEPFRYCSPPPDLASTNKPPASGQGDLAVENGASKLATVQTDDKQVLAFFPAGAFTGVTAAKITIKISPECASPPSPPAGNTLVGNVYRIEVAGANPQPPLLKAAQVLLRIPPQKLSSVQEYYDGAWHDVQWSIQTDYINLTADHLGMIAAFDDGKHSQPAPNPTGQFNPIGAIEAGLVVVAIIIVVAGIVVQRRRSKAEAAATSPASDEAHGGRRKAQGRKDRKAGPGGGKGDPPDWGPKKRS
ncbi:MAG: hypothetical protein M3O87_07685 [Candidatus Dormibacteraeota bacterium]|nr:hypothetical protein [Candidatus Dormibacteraeota bacterium]